MILTPYNDPYFYETLATPIPSPTGPPDLITPNAMVFRVGSDVAVPMGVDDTVEYIFGGEHEEREEEMEAEEALWQDQAARTAL